MDQKIDEYIAGSADFAKPILAHWRKLVHNTCPEVKEAIKWGIPHFDYKGDFMCVMAAASKHCSFTFLKADLMTDERLKGNAVLKPVKRFLGKITSLADLPPDETFVGFLQEAMELIEKGIKLVVQKSETPRVHETPDYFAQILSDFPEAKRMFESRSASYRKDYIAWITSAKSEATRQKRIEEALVWITDGKERFWKYKK